MIKPLIKALTEAGIGPRRRMAEAIKAGRIKINGRPANAFTHPIDTSKDKVVFDGKTVDLNPEKAVCLMLNKPAGILSTASDDRKRPTVINILPEKYRRYRLFPVGRLDIDTTGLILLTNDGDLTYKLTHPRYEIEKEYYAAIRGKLNKEDIVQLKRGVLLEDGRTHPAGIKEIDEPPYNYSIIIHEGRKRQVRRMFEHRHHTVLALKRVRIGNLTLGQLKEGEVRRLNAGEIAGLLGRRDAA